MKGDRDMYALVAGRGCFCPVQKRAFYGSGWAREEIALPSLVLVNKQRDVYGEMVYYIRDERGVTHMIHECKLHDFMRRRGVAELQGGSPFFYERASRKRVAGQQSSMKAAQKKRTEPSR